MVKIKASDLLKETLINLSFARNREIPRREDGRPIDPSTLWRWIRKGLAGSDGGRIKLEVLYCGNTPKTSKEAVARFFDAVTEARLARHVVDGAAGDDQRDAETQRRLEAAGLV